MPRLTKSVPKNRFHKASKRAGVTISGRDIFLGRWQRKASLIEYDRLVGEWLTAGRLARNVTLEVQLTVSELCLQCWRFAEAFYVKHGKPTGTQAGIKVAIKFPSTAYGHTSVSDSGPLALRNLQNRMLDEGQSRVYLNDNTKRIRRILSCGVSEELAPALLSKALRNGMSCNA